MEDRAAFSLNKRSSRTGRLSFVLRFAVLSALGVSLAYAQGSDALIRNVEDRYNGARTLRVNFEESLQAGGRARPPEAGVLTLQKQGKMRWDYTRPAGKLFLVDGKQVYLYTAADNRVEKMPLKSTEDMRAPLAFLLGRLDLKKEFRDFRVRPDEGGEWLEASAKNDRVPYESVAMRVRGDGSIADLKITGRDGSRMAFRFEEEVLNPRVDPKLFRFVVPAGAEVVDGVNFEAEGK
jgi:outer membrane lipoprotein carrier protein